MPPVGRDEGGDGGGDKLCGRVGEVRLQGVLVAAALDHLFVAWALCLRSDLKRSQRSQRQSTSTAEYTGPPHSNL